VSIILGIIIQVIPPVSTGAVVILSLLFPPMNFVLFIIYMAYFQRVDRAVDLSLPPPPDRDGVLPPWQVSLITLLRTKSGKVY
jgi:ATP-binding cassette subfamily A (ABC1) protein 3